MLPVNNQGLILGMFMAFLVVFSSFSTPILAEEIPAGARVAAEEGLLPFLKAIPAQDLGHFSFADQSEVDQAELGNPFMIYTILPDQIFNYLEGTDIESIIIPTGVWLYPIVSKDKARMLLTVESVDGNWQAVSIGGSGVANQWESIVESLGVESTYKFVRVYQATADFVLISDKVETKMVPLESARISLDLEGETAYDPSTVILGLRKPVRDNIEAFKVMEGE